MMTYMSISAKPDANVNGGSQGSRTPRTAPRRRPCRQVDLVLIHFCGDDSGRCGGTVECSPDAVGGLLTGKDVPAAMGESAICEVAVKAVSATELKNRFGQYLARAAVEPVAVEKNGRPVAAASSMSLPISG